VSVERACAVALDVLGEYCPEQPIEQAISACIREQQCCVQANESPELWLEAEQQLRALLPEEER
jgi:hypothetical protein